MTKPARWKMVAYTVAIFVAGGVCGSMITYRKEEASPLRVMRTQEIAARIHETLATKLELTPEQLQKIEPMIGKVSEELEASHLDCLKRIVAALESMHAEMRPLLKPDQQQKLTRLEAEWREKRKKKYNFPPEAPAQNPAAATH
jgi:hypothetical protein